MLVSSPTRKNILVIDDDADLLEIVSEILTTAGQNVTICNGTNDAIKILSSNPSGFDVVLSDVNMPNGGGMAVMTHIRDNLRTNPVRLFFSAGNNLTSECVTNLGVACVLKKPDHLYDLASFVHTECERLAV